MPSSMPDAESLGGSAVNLECSVISLHPPAIKAYLDSAILKKAQHINQLKVDLIQLRDFAIDKHGSIDSQPYGGGDGMVLRPEPLRDALQSVASHRKAYVVLTSPAGSRWSDAKAREWASMRADRHYVFVCGRFGGVDQRFIDPYVDEEVSIGDYVLSGGELATLVMLDCMVRFIPGVLGHAESATVDSFSSHLNSGLEFPLYTRPQIFEGEQVPSVLLSGDHEAIAKWREEKSQELTAARRPDLLISSKKS